MKILIFVLLINVKFCYAQHENELLKKDSVFILFSESDKQKIYSKIPIENSIELKKAYYTFFLKNNEWCNFVINRSFNYDSNGNEILKTYKLKKSFLRKNKQKIITYEEINEKGFVSYIDFLRERKVYIIDLGEAKGRHLIARGVIFSFVGEE